MFNAFFTTTQVEQAEISLKEGSKTYQLIFDEYKKIEYFKLDEVIKSCKLQKIKACDYVIVNHTKKQILLCEIKDRKVGYKSEAKEQLKHSLYIIKCFLNILDSKDYKFSKLIFNSKSLNKRTTKQKKRKYIKGENINIAIKACNFNKLKYE